MLVFGCLSPHPPIILPTVGSPSDWAKVKKTIVALEKLGKELAKVKPDCIVISSPHPDWGINVPLHFLLAQLDTEYKMETLHPTNELSIISYQQSTIYPTLTTLDSPKQHYEWGRRISHSLPRAKRGAWIASGDMSHRLKKDGPYGLHPSGPRFDQKFIDLLKKKDVQGILNMDRRLVEEAGECGLRSFCMLLGALESSKTKWEPKILSYESPFGVGYLVSRLL